MRLPYFRCFLSFFRCFLVSYFLLLLFHSFIVKKRQNGFWVWIKKAGFRITGRASPFRRLETAGDCAGRIPFEFLSLKRSKSATQSVD